MQRDEREFTGQENHLGSLGSIKCDELIPNT